MPEYVCPGCRAHDMAYECWHDESISLRWPCLVHPPADVEIEGQS